MQLIAGMFDSLGFIRLMLAGSGARPVSANRSGMNAKDVQVVEPDRFAIRWRIEGTANVPFPGLKIKPYIALQLCTCGTLFVRSS